MKVLVQTSAHADASQLRWAELGSSPHAEQQQATAHSSETGPNSTSNTMSGFFETATHMIQTMVSADAMETTPSKEESNQQPMKETGEDMISALRQMNSRIGREKEHLVGRRQARKQETERESRQEDNDLNPRRIGKYVLGRNTRQEIHQTYGTEVGAVEVRLADGDEKNKNLKIEISQLQTQLKESQSAAAAAKKRATDLEERMNLELKDAHKCIAASADEITNLRQINCNQASKHRTLSDVMQLQQQTTDKLEIKVKELRQASLDKDSQVEEMTKSSRNANEKVVELTELLADKTLEASEALYNSKKAKEDLKSAEDYSQRLERKNETLEKSHLVLEQERDSIDRERDELKVKVEEFQPLREELAKERAKNESTRLELENKENLIQQLEEATAALQESFEFAQEQMATEKTEKDNVEQVNQTMVQEMEKFRVETEDQRLSIVDFERKLEIADIESNLLRMNLDVSLLASEKSKSEKEEMALRVGAMMTGLEKYQRELKGAHENIARLTNETKELRLSHGLLLREKSELCSARKDAESQLEQQRMFLANMKGQLVETWSVEGSLRKETVDSEARTNELQQILNVSENRAKELEVCLEDAQRQSEQQRMFLASMKGQLVETWNVEGCLRKEIDNSEAQAEELRKSLYASEQRATDLEVSLGGAQEKIQSLEQETKELRGVNGDLEGMKRQISKLHQAMNEQATRQIKHLESLETQLNDTWHREGLLQQELVVSRNSTKDAWKTLKESEASATANIAALEAQLKDYVSHNARVHNDLEHARIELESAKQAREDARNEVKETNGALVKLETELKISQENSRLIHEENEILHSRLLELREIKIVLHSVEKSMQRRAGQQDQTLSQLEVKLEEASERENHLRLELDSDRQELARCKSRLEAAAIEASSLRKKIIDAKKEGDGTGKRLEGAQRANKELVESVSSYQQDLDFAHDRITELEKENDKLRERTRDVTRKSEQLQRAHGAVQYDTEKQREMLVEVQEKLEEILTERDSLKSELEVAQAEIVSAKNNLEDGTKYTKTMENILATHQSDLEKARKRIDVLASELAKVVESNRTLEPLKDEIQTLQIQLEESKAVEDTLRKDLQETQTLLETTTGSSKEEVKQFKEQSELALSTKIQELEQAHERIVALQKQIDDLQSSNSELKDVKGELCRVGEAMLSQAEQQRAKFNELKAKLQTTQRMEATLQETIVSYKTRAEELEKKLTFQQAVATRAQKDKETCQTMLKQAVGETKKAGDKLLEANSRIRMLEDEVHNKQQQQQQQQKSSIGCGDSGGSSGKKTATGTSSSETKDGYWNISFL